MYTYSNRKVQISKLRQFRGRPRFSRDVYTAELSYPPTGRNKFKFSILALDVEPPRRLPPRDTDLDRILDEIDKVVPAFEVLKRYSYPGLYYMY